jgi:Tfp pilus assembly protein PilZ
MKTLDIFDWSSPMETKTEERVAPPSSAPTANERRGHQRVRCQGDVELRRIPPAPPQSISGKIKNLSEGGCFVETERPLDIGERLVMEIRLDGLELRMIAEVRSVKIDPSCSAGLEFVGISAQGLQKLKALIEVIARDQTGSPESAAKQ